MFFKDLVQPWRKPLRRYYIKSLFPCALTILIFVIGVSAPQLLLAPWQKLTWVLLVMLPFLWSLKIYLQYLGECDEVERKIELHAIAVGAFLALTSGMSLILAMATQLIVPTAEFVLWMVMLSLCIGYAVSRSYLLWRYLK